ncbi:MAG: GDP-mannose 4,6-dehydratase [Nitrospirota bacterium]
MRVLITGVNGFAGSHLAEHLLGEGYDVAGTVLHAGHVESIAALRDHLRLYEADVTRPETLGDAIAKERPEQVYHLAGVAFVKDSWTDPEGTYRTNFLGTFHLYEALARSEIEARVLFASSAEVYGAVQGSELLGETFPPRPITPYAVSKAAAELLGVQYGASGRISVLCARAFNHIGPRQDPRFVCANFARQIAEIEAGRQPPVIHVGNLDVARDFTDVRDIARAYRLIMEHGRPGEVYNVCSGEACSIQTILDRLLGFANIPIRVEVDPSRVRPVDIPVLRGDPSKLEGLGWRRTIPLDQSLRDIIADARARLAGAR